MKGKFVMAVACAAIAVSGTSFAKAPRSASPITLTLSGEGRWTVSCTLEVGNGLIDRQEFKNGRSAPTVFQSDNLKHGSCDYKVGPDKGLTVAVEGDAWACPLSAAADAKCEQTLAPGATGSLRLTRRGER